MTSSRPYLIEALYKWINDNQLTPYILVNAELPEVYVPKEFIQDGKIVLNIAPDAIYDLRITKKELEFHASFSGVSRHLSMPIPAVLAIYAQENGQGMAFGQEPGVDLPPDTPPEEPTNNKEPSTKKPHLKVVK